MKPRFFRSRLIASDSGVVAGTSFIDRGRLTFGAPPTNCQMYGVEATEFLLDVEKGARVLHGAIDLQAVADDARDRGAARGVLRRVVPRDLLRIELAERPPVGRPLAQDRDPAEAGLRAFENQHLEEMAVVVHGTPHSSSW